MEPVHAAANALPLVRPRGVASISTIAISGTGLIAIPTAEVSICPMASPIVASPRLS